MAEDLPYIGVNVFINCVNLKSIYVRTYSIDEYKRAYGWGDYVEKYNKEI